MGILNGWCDWTELALDMIQISSRKSVKQRITDWVHKHLALRNFVLFFTYGLKYEQNLREGKQSTYFLNYEYLTEIH
jgi:hypothetical protein